MSKMLAKGEAPATPPFSLDKPKYDTSTFVGRFKNFLNVVDPRTLLTSKDELQHAVTVLDNFKAHPRSVRERFGDDQLWQLKKTRDAIINQGTGEHVLPPFRMSGFVPFGVPIAVGLLLPAPSVATTVFYQVLNQCHNAAVNYYNRSSPVPVPTTTLAASFTGAVGTAVGVSLGLRSVLQRAQTLPPTTRALIQRFTPFPAVALAGVANVLFMRWSELTTGIAITDDQGNELGMSQVAAKVALQQTAVTRAILPVPILVFPPLAMLLVERTSLLKKFPKARLPVQAMFVTAAFGFALPVAISLFPQISSIAPAALEPKFRQLRRADGTPMTEVFFNKGL